MGNGGLPFGYLEEDRGPRRPDHVNSLQSAHVPPTDCFRYTNTITDQQQSSLPPEFRGGLLADQMGLGKSLSMISLIAAHPAVDMDLKAVADCAPGTQIPVKATLLIVPFSCKKSFVCNIYENDICLRLIFSVLTTWDHQLKRSANAAIP